MKVVIRLADAPLCIEIKEAALQLIGNEVVIVPRDKFAINRMMHAISQYRSNSGGTVECRMHPSGNAIIVEPPLREDRLANIPWIESVDDFGNALNAQREYQKIYHREYYNKKVKNQNKTS